MAYQDDFKNKVIAALKSKNLAVDISQEATQQAIKEEAQNVAASEARPMSPEEMQLVLSDVANQLANESQQFTAQSSDFTAFQNQLASGGSYSGGGIAVSVANKDIMIIPTAGTATSVNTLSQIDFKFISNPNAYGVFDPNEVKSSLFNWAERISGNTYDTPVLGIGGAWNGVSYAPTSQWGIGGSQGSGIGGSINTDKGFGQVIYFKPATSSVYASIFNDLGFDTSYTNRTITITGYQQPVPGSFPTAGFAVTFGGIGNSGDLVIQGAISEAQTNTIKFLSPLTVSNTTATDTLTLGLSSAIPTTENFVGGGNAQYVLSTTSSSFSQGDIFYASATGHTHLIRLAIGANNTYLTSNGTVPSWTGSIAANTVAVNAATGATILYPLLNNIAGSGSAISTDIDFSVDPGNNILRYATGSFYVGTAVSSPTFTSITNIAIKPGTNSQTAIQFQAFPLAGTASTVLSIDTTNSRVSINPGTTTPTYTLEVYGDTNLSTGSVFRIAGTSVLSNNTLGSTVTASSLTSVGTIATGAWAATAITAHYGGTGLQSPFVIGDVIYANTATTWARLAAVATGSVLASQGTGTAPAYVATSTLTVGTATTATNLNVNNAIANTAHTVLFSPTATGTGIAVSSNTTISFNPSSFILSTSGLAVTNTTASTTTGSGALIVSGGFGLAGNAFIGGTVYVPSATASNFSNLLVSNTTATTSTTSGALVVSGGLGLAGSAFIGGTVYVPSTSVSNISSVTFANGVVTAGNWNGTAVGTTYGGTGSNLGPGASVGNSNRIIVTGGSGAYAASLIDNATSGNLLVSGGPLAAPTFTNTTAAAFTFSSGALTINNAVITQGTVSNTPTNANDLVNKSYADSLSGGLDPHASVRLTTISAIGGSYRQVGTAGTTWGQGDYIIATAPNTLIGADGGFDPAASGIALTNGQRVLVKDGVLGGYASGNGAYGAYPTTYGGFAASWVANGIYTVASYGGAATSGWLLIRATDTDNNSGVQELTGGTFTFVEEGTNYADNGFVCTNDTTTLGPIGFGATQISWSAFSGGAALINGQGISKTGNTIATNLNLAQFGTVVTNLSSGFSIGGTRQGSVGSSSYATFIVDGSTALSTNTFTALATGFSLAGGQTNRTLTVQGAGNITLDGGGNTLTLSGSSITLTGNANTLTLSSSSTLNLNSQALAIANGSNNITLQSGSASGNTAATTQILVQNGQSQYNLSTANSTMALGDLYYGGQSSVGWTSMARLALGGTGASVLIRNATVPVWGTIALASSDYVSGILGISNGGTNTNATPTNGGVSYGTGSAYAFTGAGTANSVLLSTGAGAPIWGAVVLSNSNAVSGTLTTTNGGTSNGSITVTNGQVVYTDGNKLNTTAVGIAGQAFISNGSAAPSFGTLTLAGGGTSNTASGSAVQYQLAAYNASGNGISGIAQPTASFSVLIQSAANNLPTWSNGPLSFTYGGNGNSTFTSKGVVYTNIAGTANTSDGTFTYQSGFGLTITGANTTINVGSGGGYFINGSAVVSSLQGINGAVTISSSASNGGTSYLSTSSQNLVLNYPGTGITGTGTATQVPYYTASSTLSGDVGLVYSRTAATGIGLSLNINATSGTILRVNSAQSFTSGLLLDVDNNGTQAYAVDWKGMATHTASSGNTALVISVGRTILSAPNANYASINFGNTNANPGAGITQIGDLWFNGTNLYFRKDANTNFDLLVGSVSGSGTANKIAKWSSTTGLTDSNITDAGVGMTITATSAVGVGLGSTAYLTIQSLSGDEVAGIKNNAYFIRGIQSASNSNLKVFSVDIAGNLRATTKSFDIPHPTKEGMRLVYGVLEGPEHGVYHRGTVEGKGIIQVNLPEYWHKLVGDQYTIQLTPWGNYNVCIGSKTENYFTIQLVGDLISRKFKNIKVDYIVHGSRLDAPLDIEQ